MSFFSCSGPRKWKLVVSQVSMSIENRNVLRKLEDIHSDLLIIRACLGSFNAIYPKVLCKDGIPFNYPSILQVFLLLSNYSHITKKHGSIPFYIPDASLHIYVQPVKNHIFLFNYFGI